MECDRRRTPSCRRELRVLTRHAITRQADQDGVDAAVAERDYVLAHIVAQLHLLQTSDKGRLVFKGGTALRMVHIDNYRYSADLDFTMIEGSIEDAMLAMVQVLAAAREQADFPSLELAEGDTPSILYVGPLGASKPRRIKIDVSDSEVVDTVEQRTILPTLWSDLPVPLPFDVYPASEIAAEKVRCIIQRVQCRNLYDIFRLVQDLGVDLTEVRPLFGRKAEARRIDPASFEERLEDRLIRYKSRWDAEMSEHLVRPPRFDDFRHVRRHFRSAGLIEG